TFVGAPTSRRPRSTYFEHANPAAISKEEPLGVCQFPAREVRSVHGCGPGAVVPVLPLRGSVRCVPAAMPHVSDGDRKRAQERARRTEVHLSGQAVDPSDEPVRRATRRSGRIPVPDHVLQLRRTAVEQEPSGLSQEGGGPGYRDRTSYEPFAALVGSADRRSGELGTRLPERVDRWLLAGDLSGAPGWRGSGPGKTESGAPRRRARSARGAHRDHLQVSGVQP